MFNTEFKNVKFRSDKTLGCEILNFEIPNSKCWKPRLWNVNIL